MSPRARVGRRKAPALRISVVYLVYHPVVHECAKHLLPTFGYRWCYAELKDRLAAGEHLTIEELAFVGEYGQRRSTGGWHQPGNLSAYELDAEVSAEDTAILQALMSVGTSQDRLEFLG